MHSAFRLQTPNSIITYVRILGKRNLTSQFRSRNKLRPVVMAVGLDGQVILSQNHLMAKTRKMAHFGSLILFDTYYPAQLAVPIL